MPISGKVVIVTGGANGIGLACARRFAKDGAKVVLADINEKAASEAAQRIIENGGEAAAAHCDVGDRLHVHNMVAASLDSFDRIDALLNCAAIRIQGEFLTLDEESYDNVLRVNLKGSFLTGQAVAKQMVKQAKAAADEGRRDATAYSIVNMTSINAVIAVAEQVPYSISQGGLNQLTKVMALSLAPHGIRVNAIGPGTVMTDMVNGELSDSAVRNKVLERTPMGRIGEPDEIASIAVFLVSEDSSYMTGQTLYADGGRLILNENVAKSR